MCNTALKLALTLFNVDTHLNRYLLPVNECLIQGL